MQFAFNLVRLLCLPLMSRTPCVPVSYVSLSFSVLPACPPSSANVLICCLVQPDGLLPQHWEKKRGGRQGGRKGSYLQRSPLIKNPSVEITHPTPTLTLHSFSPLSQDSGAIFYQALSGSGYVQTDLF